MNTIIRVTVVMGCRMLYCPCNDSKLLTTFILPCSSSGSKVKNFESCDAIVFTRSTPRTPLKEKQMYNVLWQTLPSVKTFMVHGCNCSILEYFS